MSRKTKRKRKIAQQVDRSKMYSLQAAIELLKACPDVKFDQSMDVAFRLGVDSKKSDQNVRGTVTLPCGTGKNVIVVVLAKGDKVQEAREAQADFVGNDDLIEKIQGGWTEFDVLIATPEMMRDVGKLGKVLGPRGLMPTPKARTVTTEVGKAVQEVKAGKIEFKSDRYGCVNCAFGKRSFTVEALVENFNSLIQALLRARPSTVKGLFITGIVLSSTMGPGLKLDLRIVEANN